MKKPKILVLSFVFSALFFVGVTLFFIFLVDPFKIYHKPLVCPEQVFEARNMRYNAKWILDRGGYDSLIFGSSNMVNISSKGASRVFGGKFINVSILGSNFKERSLIFDYIFSKLEPKVIITSLDKYILANIGALENEEPNWKSIFDNNKINDLNIYLNNKFFPYIFKEGVKYLLGFKAQCFYADMDRAAVIDKDTNLLANITTAKFLSDYIAQIKVGKKPDNYDINYINAHLEKYLLRFIKEHKNTEFILIIPPYFLAFSAADDQAYNFTRAQKEAIKYILAQNLPNLKIYAFDDLDINQNEQNYSDLAHYKKEIDIILLDLIAQNKGLITNENFEAYWAKYEAKAKSFDLFKFYEKAVKSLEN